MNSMLGMEPAYNSLFPSPSAPNEATLAFARASLPLADTHLSLSLCRDLLVLKAPLDEMVLPAPR